MKNFTASTQFGREKNPVQLGLFVSEFFHCIFGSFYVIPSLFCPSFLSLLFLQTLCSFSFDNKWKLVSGDGLKFYRLNFFPFSIHFFQFPSLLLSLVFNFQLVVEISSVTDLKNLMSVQITCLHSESQNVGSWPGT